MLNGKIKKKNIINDHYNVLEILLYHCLSLLTLTGIRGQIQPAFRLLTNEIIILGLKFNTVALKLWPHSILTFRHCIEAIFQKFPVTAHHHLCLQMFEGKCLISILKIRVQKLFMTDCCQTFDKNISKTF